MTSQPTVTVMGAGSWGTALAQHLASNGCRVALWGRDPELLEAIAQSRRNSVYLPDVELSDNIHIQKDLLAAVAAGELLTLAAPCAATRALLERFAPEISRRHLGLVWTSKGFESPSGLLMSEVIGQCFAGRLPTACLSGPSFAREVAAGLPTAVTLASSDATFARRAAKIFHSGNFRVYPSEDLIGVEVAGALKNVIAISVGISDGLGFGANARAALITRGVAETQRLAVAMGGRRETLSGLAGIGDIVLSATDDQSRNRRFGLLLAEETDPEEALKRIGQTIEGVHTLAAARQLAEKHGVEMPICSQLAAVLAGRCTPKQAAEALAARSMQHEA